LLDPALLFDEGVGASERPNLVKFSAMKLGRKIHFLRLGNGTGFLLLPKEIWPKYFSGIEK